jgi:hypothetical protein
MRTKVLLCVAALAASLASSMAQNVYSLNVVGYYNVTIPAGGLYMVANQLNTTNNTLDGVMFGVADGSQFYKYAGGYSAYAYDAFGGPSGNGGWVGSPPNQTLNPGEAGFFKDVNGGTGQVITFVGEVLQNTSPGLVNTLPIGNSIRASMVPQQGTATGDLKIPGEDGDQLYVYNNGYAAYAYDAFQGATGGWTGNGVPDAGPIINVGQGFFYKKAAASVTTTWVRSFTVQ